MTNLFINCLAFVLGMVIGIIWFKWILVPMFYWLPKSIFYTIKKRTKPAIVLSVLWRPFLVILILFICGFIWGERLINFIENHVWVINGVNLYIVYSVIGLILFKGKRQQQYSYFKLLALWYKDEKFEWSNKIAESRSEKRSDFV